MLWVAAEDAAPEYWVMRRFDFLIAALGDLRALLTCTALLVAVGVGDASASAQWGVLCSEVAGAASSALGLAASTAVPSAWIAARSRSLLALCLLARVLLLGALPLLLQARGAAALLPVVCAEAVLGTLLGVVEGPANAALWNHIVRGTDARRRAETERKTANQDRAVAVLRLALRALCLVLAAAAPAAPAARVWGAWGTLAALQCAAGMWRLLRVAAPPTLDLQRLDAAVAVWTSGPPLPSLALSPGALCRAERGIAAQLMAPAQLWPLRLGVELRLPGDGDAAHAAHVADCCTLLALQAGAGCALLPGNGGGVDGKESESSGALPRQELHGVIREGATADDLIQATLLAALVRRRLLALRSCRGPSGTAAASPSPSEVCAAIAAAVAPAAAQAPAFLAALRQAGCDTRSVLLDPGPWRLLHDTGDGNALRGSRLVGDGTTHVRTWATAATAADGTRRWTAVVAGEGDGAGPTHGGSAVAATAAAVIVWLKCALLPSGFPTSVASDYLHYQLWDTLQVLCGDLRGVVVAQAALVGSGVGSAAASPMSVVWTDLLVSLVGQALQLAAGAASSAGSVNDLKRWRVVGAVLDGVRSALRLGEGADPSKRWLFRISATAVEGAVRPLASGASTAVTMHLSKGSLDASFRADVAAKEGNQDRVLGLVLLAFRLLLLRWIGLHSPRAAAAVLVLSAGHLLCNYLAAASLALRALNAERARVVLARWDGGSGACLTPGEVARVERVLWPRQPPVKLGVPATHLASSATLRKLLLDCHSADAYVLGVDASAAAQGRAVRLCCALREGQCDEDVLKAFLHGDCVQRALRARHSTTSEEEIARAIMATHAECNALWPSFQDALKAAGWQADVLLVSTGSTRIKAHTQ